MNSQNDKFDLLTNGADVTKLGFKLEPRNMYESLISPFYDDQEKPHPFKVINPQSFSTFEFFLDKIDKSKLPDECLIYIFYNIIDEKMQFMAAQLLISKKILYHKKLKVWVKDIESKPSNFFNIKLWKWTEFKMDVKDDDFYTLKNFKESMSK